MNKPGIIISFDDGLYSNYIYASKLLEKYGFTGWFMIPVGFAEIDLVKQYEFAMKGDILYNNISSNYKIGMSWDDIIDLSNRNHVIGCHSFSHIRLSDKLTNSQIYNEIHFAKELLESKMKNKMDIFTWVGGEGWSCGKDVFNSIKNANCKYVFCTNCKSINKKVNKNFLERYHVDSFYNLFDVRFVLSGFYDIKYFSKRERIYKKLNQ